jgi:hypothetical protein
MAKTVQMISSNYGGFAMPTGVSFVAPLLTSNEHFGEWLNQIHCIPDIFIDRVCADTLGIGAIQAEVEFLQKFLKFRKRNLGEIIENHRAFFRSIKSWGIM